MSEKLIIYPNFRLPTNASEQLLALPPFPERERVLSSLFKEVSRLLSENDITINTIKSTYRVKTEKRIQAKINRRGASDPILDLYAMRFVMMESAKSKASQLIMKRYPTPPEFPWGKPSFRNYSDEETKRQFRKMFNPNIDPAYTATHINILFGKDEIANIAEVQLMTEQELKFAETIWSNYTIAQENMVQRK